MTLEITLPDRLALEAQQAGLLTPELLERWLEEQLRTRRVTTLLESMERMSAVSDPPYMSPEEVAKEIRAMKAERRAAR